MLHREDCGHVQKRPPEQRRVFGSCCSAIIRKAETESHRIDVSSPVQRMSAFCGR